MKKSIICSFALLLNLVFFYYEGNSQVLEFIYAAPRENMDANFSAVESFIRDETGELIDLLPGYGYIIIDPSNVTSFQTHASPNLKKTYNSITISSSSLRGKLNRILKLSNNKVSKITFFLIDDRTGVPDETDEIFCPSQNNSMNIVWPCAANWQNNASTGMYTARVMLGEKSAELDAGQAGGFNRWEATVIHEISHTQMLRDPNGINKWDNPNLGIHGLNISYGGDRGHWFSELQADEQQPMDEGLGYFWALEHDPSMAQELDDFLNNTDHRFWLGSRSFLTGTSEMWNSPNTVVCSGIPCVSSTGITYNVSLTNPSLTSSSYELRSYRWLDVPGKYVFYNEQMSQAYFYLFHRYGFLQKSTSYNKIFDAVQKLCMNPNQRHRYPAHVANMLANSMEAYARSSEGKAEAQNNTIVSSMFAYALFDLLGHFGHTESDLRRQFDINSATYIPYTPKPSAFIQYWAHRDQVKQIACQYLGGNGCNPSTTGTIDIHKAVTAIRDYFKKPVTILR